VCVDGVGEQPLLAAKGGHDQRVTTASEPHYRAFISYSHADSAVAAWLHRALESYHVPANLVGKETPVGPVPRRLTPIFRDRDELAASGDLSTGLKDALAAAQFLIVIASPSAAQSRWVNEEVRTFKHVHGEGKVLTVIAAGEPGSADAECFPPAVQFRVRGDGLISDQRAEPIAADLRAHGDGKRLAKLKLIAGLTGLKLDDLVQREAARRQTRMTWLAAAASLLALIMTGLTVVAVRARGEAEHQRAEADGLVEFMLTDLRKKLEPVGRLDALDVVGQRALKYYGEQDPGSLDADALGRRSRALHLVGEVRNTRGDSEGALVAFRQAAATTGELLTRDPDNGQRIFDQAQSVFWVGYVAYQRGQAKEAEAAFRAYKRYADRLVQIDPKNTDWQMEVSYADSNLGTLLLDQARYAEAETAFAAALKIVEVASARKPADAQAQIDVGQAISWLATAKDRLNKMPQAIALLRREIAIYAGVLKSDPTNMTAKSSSVAALQTIGRLKVALGDNAASIAAYRSATEVSGALIKIEPNNSKWREMDSIAHYGLAKSLFFNNNHTLSGIEISKADQSLDELIRRDRKNITWNIILKSELDVLRGGLIQSEGNCKMALPLFAAASAQLKRVSSDKNPVTTISLGWAEQWTGDCHKLLGDTSNAVSAWQSAAAAIRGPNEILDSTQLAIRYAVFRRLGRYAEASQISAILDQNGYRHPYYELEKASARGTRSR
jgi:tetratricopeptide (TPR) repeat protein